MCLVDCSKQKQIRKTLLLATWLTGYFYSVIISNHNYFVYNETISQYLAIDHEYLNIARFICQIRWHLTVLFVNTVIVYPDIMQYYSVNFNPQNHASTQLTFDEFRPCTKSWRLLTACCTVMKYLYVYVTSHVLTKLSKQ